MDLLFYIYQIYFKIFRILCKFESMLPYLLFPVFVFFCLLCVNRLFVFWYFLCKRFMRQRFFFFFFVSKFVFFFFFQIGTYIYVAPTCRNTKLRISTDYRNLKGAPCCVCSFVIISTVCVIVCVCGR